jgi:hypothetical protein
VRYHFEAGASKVIENPTATVVSSCQIRDLNSYFGMRGSNRDFPETAFFGPRVDTPAATAQQRTDWARFTVSFAVRTPEALRQMGPEETRKAFALVEARVKGPPDAERKVSALIQREMQKLERKFPLECRYGPEY